MDIQLYHPPNLCKCTFIPLFAGSKTPTLKFGKCAEVKWEINARKCPIGSTNNPWSEPFHGLKFHFILY
ncbi:hypothetical protein DN400_03205 [Bacillus sp. AR8-1]|nr:hypothetical protein DN400_03205 [Bacillus sp. AR8-1]